MQQHKVLDHGYVGLVEKPFREARIDLHGLREHGSNEICPCPYCCACNCEKCKADWYAVGRPIASACPSRGEHKPPQIKMDPSAHDKVDHPSHYTSDPSGVECITVVEHRNFNIGNAIKYLWRAGLKEGQATDDDLRKSIWYIERERQRLAKSKAIKIEASMTDLCIDCHHTRRNHTLNDGVTLEHCRANGCACTRFGP